VGTGTLTLTLGSAAYAGGNLKTPIMYVIGCAFVSGGYGVGFGPIPWVLSSEMFPTAIRGRIMSISLIVSNAAQLAMNMVFLLMANGMTTAGTFGFFFAMTLACFSFVSCFCVETKTLTPSRIRAAVLQQRERALQELRQSPVACLVRSLCCALSFLNSSNSSNSSSNSSNSSSINSEVGAGMNGGQVELAAGDARALLARHVDR
jgi:hypothetical protein